MKNNQKKISWLVFLSVTCFVLGSFAYFYIGLQAHKTQECLEYESLLSAHNHLQKEYDNYSSKLTQAQTNRSIVASARESGYLSSDEMLLRIAFPENYNENQIYFNEYFNPYD